MTKPNTTTSAVTMQAEAKRKRAYAKEIASHDPTGAYWERKEATELEQRAEEILTLPAEQVTIGSGGEITPLDMSTTGALHLTDTVKTSPDYITACASYDRLNLAADAEILNLAVDTAETLGARNSLEKMLAHQMAASHALAMKLTAKASHYLYSAGVLGPSQQCSIEAARLAGSAARLMDAFQKSMLTLARIRNGGKQVVTVQHVQIADGGQAIITGSTSTQGPRGGRKKQ